MHLISIPLPKNLKSIKTIILMILFTTSLLLTFYFQAILKNENVFTHFLYIPIILAALWMGLKGIIVPMFLTLFLLLTHEYPQAPTLSHHHIRAVMFFLVFFCILILHRRAKKSKKTLEAANLELIKKQDLLRNSLNSIITDHRTLKKSKEELDEIHAQLKLFTDTLEKRNKELNCFYKLGSITEEPDISIEELLQGLVSVLPSGWRHSNDACARIIFQNKEYLSDSFKITPWKQEGEIRTNNAATGRIEIYYQNEKPLQDEGPFSKEERNLLNGLCQRVGQTIERLESRKILEQAEITLRNQKEELEHKNIALKELLCQIELEKQNLRENVVTNVEKLLLPNLRRLKRTSPALNAKHLTAIEQNLENLTPSLGRKASDLNIKLTPREIEICGMIKNGLLSKEISDALHLSPATIEVHRNSIRRKLGITNKDINLTTYLQTL